MCGLAGFAGIPEDRRLLLVYSLGVGIDSRGGDASGFVTLNDRPVSFRKPGTWTRASARFSRAAADGDICLMHARLATCGERENPSQAHPFAIKRWGRTVLWGAHNGMIYDADDSAKANGRSYSVDSKELFELLADGEHIKIQELTGYGVATWIEAGSRHVNLSKLSDDGEIVVAKVHGGGTVWASTWPILKRATDFAGIKVKSTYKIEEVGRVYEIHTHGVHIGHRTGIHVNNRWNWVGGSDSPTYWGQYESPDSVDRWIAAYMQKEGQ